MKENSLINNLLEKVKLAKSKSPLLSNTTSKVTLNQIFKKKNGSFINNESNMSYDSNKKTMWKDRSTHLQWDDSDISKNQEQIKNHLIKQNNNLKDHRDFLNQELFKQKQKVDKYKQKVKKHQQKIYELEYEKQLLRLQNLQLKSNLKSSLQQTHNLVEHESTVIRDVTTQKHNITCLDELNLKFDAAMLEYKNTKSKQAKKQCCEIAKQIKHLKQSCELQDLRDSDGKLNNESSMQPEVDWIHRLRSNKQNWR